MLVGCYQSHRIVEVGDTGALDAPRDTPRDGPIDAPVDVGADVGAPPGCADGTREGLSDAARYPDVAACAGVFAGWIDEGSADALCSPGWHVCRGDDAVVHALTEAEANGFGGCFAFDAAQDCGACFPSCRGAMGACLTCCVSATDPTDPDMAGIGLSCARVSSGPSCLADVRLDASTNTFGCAYDPRLRGVVCCAD